MNALSIIESYPSELNPVDKWILSLVDNPSLGGWGVFLFFLIRILQLYFFLLLFLF